MAMKPDMKILVVDDMSTMRMARGVCQRGDKFDIGTGHGSAHWTPRDRRTASNHNSWWERPNTLNTVAGLFSKD